VSSGRTSPSPCVRGSRTGSTFATCVDENITVGVTVTASAAAATCGWPPSSDGSTGGGPWLSTPAPEKYTTVSSMLLLRHSPRHLARAHVIAQVIGHATYLGKKGARTQAALELRAALAPGTGIDTADGRTVPVTRGAGGTSNAAGFARTGALDHGFACAAAFPADVCGFFVRPLPLPPMVGTAARRCLTRCGTPPIQLSITRCNLHHPTPLGFTQVSTSPTVSRRTRAAAQSCAAARQPPPGVPAGAAPPLARVAQHPGAGVRGAALEKKVPSWFRGSGRCDAASPARRILRTAAAAAASAGAASSAAAAAAVAGTAAASPACPPKLDVSWGAETHEKQHRPGRLDAGPGTRGLHSYSSTSQLTVNTCCGTCSVVSVTNTAQVEVRSGRVEAHATDWP